MSSEMIGIIGFIVLFILIFLKVPIAFAFVLTGVGGLIWLLGFEPAVSTLGQFPYSWISSYTYSCIPFFILLGLLIAYSGAAKDMFTSANAWVGRVSGGLAMGTLMASALFSAISGSSVAAVSSFAPAVYPELKKYKYAPSLSTGAITAGASMNIMIPPSIPMIIFALIAEVSVGKFMMAGFGPGLLELLIFCIIVFVMVKLNPRLAPVTPGDVPPFWEKVKLLRHIVPIIVIFLSIFGGLFAGIFTPTEAGAFGVLATLLVLLVMRRLTWKVLTDALLQTAMLMGVIFMLFMGVAFFNAFCALSGIPQTLSNWLTSMNMSPQVFLIVVMLIYLPLGALMEEISMVLLTVPIFLPAIHALGIDPLYFGILVIVAWQIGFIIPPVAMLCFVTKSVVKEVPLGEIYKGSLPFVVGLLIVALIIIFVPDIALWLPRMMKYG